ncbi:MAG: putative DNA binding domain-containing protein [Lentisphaeria bacterium]|nr:putative DNA binding domain-containing protein [Lentisphaeria bacterium]
MNENTDIFEELVKRGVESEHLDYKGPMNFRSIGKPGQAKIARHMAALANSGGGHIVIGVGEDASGHPSVYTGLNAAEAHSFDPSNVGPIINHLIEPPVDFVIERPLVDGKRYAIIKVRPFETMPHVCSLGVAPELQQGVFYIRTSEAASRPACRAIELHGLFKRALLKQRSQLAELLRDILSEEKIPLDTNDSDRYFEDDAAYSRGYFVRRKQNLNGFGTSVIELQIRPGWNYDQQKFTLDTLREAVNKAAELKFLPGNLLTSRDVRSAYFTNTSLRAMPDNEFRMWQFSRSGLFELLLQVPAQESGSFANLNNGLLAALQKIQQIYNFLLPEGGNFKVILAIYDSVKQLTDPYTAPSGQWQINVNSKSFNQEAVQSLISNLADYIL